MAFESRISRHLEKVETCSMRMYKFGQLKTFLSVLIEFYVNHRLNELFNGIQLSGLKDLDFDADLELLLGGLKSDWEETRWTLSFLELKHLMSPRFWKTDGLKAVELFEYHLAKATPLEKYNWAKIYIESRETDDTDFDFATGPILDTVQESEIIKTRLLRELSLDNPRQLGFLLYAIPHDRRLKEIRYRHLADRPLQRKVGKMQSIYKVMDRVPGISKTVAYQLLGLMEEGHLFQDGEGKSRFIFNGETSLAFVTWMLSLMTIYQFRWPLDLDADQVALLLSRKSEPTSFFSYIKDLNIGEGTRVQERLELAQAMALRTLPRLLSLDEILCLLLPKQELLEFKTKNT